MNKAELVKIISKKATVSETSSKELFDLFLRKIADELQPGDSAQFSNVGYFHLRKGKIKKEGKDTDVEDTEYLDLIIFSSDFQLNIKSLDNLVFSVPEPKDTKQDSLDSHFSLSADKPVLPDLNSKSAFTSDSHEFNTDQILNRKVESLIVNLQKEERIQEDSEILLVEMKTIDEDQFELELDEESKSNNSEKIPDSTIHSSEKLKSRASDFGKDLTNQINEESISEVDEEKKGIDVKEEISGWDFGKRFWSDSPASGGSDKKELDKTEPKETSINERDFADKKLEDDNDPAETIIKKTENKNLEPEMDDFQVSDEEEKIEKFERVRPITSSLSDEALSEKVDGFEKFVDDSINIENEEIDNDDEFEKISIKAKIFGSEGTDGIEKKTGNAQSDIKFNKAEAVRKHRRDSRKSSASIFLTIAAIFIIVAAVLYLFMQDNNTTELVEETLPQIERITSVTYIERSYDIPVTYPYLKPETEMKIVGLNLIEIKDEEPEKIIEDNNPPKKVVENKTPIKKEVTEDKPTVSPPVNDPPKKVVENKPPVKKEVTEEKPTVSQPVNDPPKKVVENKPPVKKEVTEEKPEVSVTVKKPSGTPVRKANNIYKYEDIYTVQVASLRKKNSAENEAAKYIAKGYNAFLEVAILEGVTWHRVRVGNFDTLEKAKQFIKSNN